MGLPQWLSSKESTCNTGDLGLIPGWGRSPGGAHGIPLQYSSLENPMDGGAWQGTVHRVTKSLTWLSNWACTHILSIYSRSLPRATLQKPSHRLYVLWLKYVPLEGAPGLFIEATARRQWCIFCYHMHGFIYICIYISLSQHRFYLSKA